LNQSTKLPRMVARKSVGNNRAQPGDKCSNVARKSTGGQSKFWRETRLETPYSFYGLEQPQIDPKHVKTKMAMGGMEIKLDVEKFSNLVNLDVKLIVKDCVKESIDLDDL